MLVRNPAITPEVRNLLGRAMGDGTCDDAALDYLDHPGAELYGWAIEGIVVCAATIKREGVEGELVHIATQAMAERHGHGRALIRAVIKDLGLARIVAETDDAAVGFYERVGFTTEALESPWPTPRFRCTLSCT